MEEKKKNKSKTKGNNFERTIAKILSNWFFKDDTILYRESSSGARGTTNNSRFNGDIVIYDPIKFNEHWKKFPFLIECKNGYKDNIPTFNNWNKVKEWILKLIKQKNEEQHILFLITQFHHQQALLITDQLLQNCLFDICLLIQDENNNISYFYIYKLKELLEKDFYSLFDINIKSLFL